MVDVEFGGENTGEVIDKCYLLVVVPFELLTASANADGSARMMLKLDPSKMFPSARVAVA